MLVDIRGFPNYQISDDGSVYSKKRNIYLKPYKDEWKYSTVSLFKNGVRKNRHIHRLVVEAFIPNPENKPEVNHKNGIKSDNNVVNLEWSTASENKKHAFLTGLNDRKSYDAGRPKRKVMIVETGMQFDSLTECADYLHCTHSSVLFCIQGKTKTCKGYTIVPIS